MSSGPHSIDAEASVVARLLAEPKSIGEVVGSLLEGAHFESASYRLLYEAIEERYYADDPMDPLSVAESIAVPLSRSWDMDPSSAVRRVKALVDASDHGEAADHAVLVKRDADYRALILMARKIERDVQAEAADPDAIASDASQAAMQIATNALLTDEIMDFAEIGRRLIRRQREMATLRAAGVEVGAYFGLRFLDSWTRGFQPSELFVLAGEPGAGKSAVAWTAAQRFAERQGEKPEDQRVGCLILSLEMAEEPSSIRIAQAITGIDGGTLREGSTSKAQMQTIVDEWSKRRDIPLYINHASIIRAPQLRALVVEAIRRHNVGLVIVDHWRYVKMPGNYAGRRNEEDGEKAEFFKQRIAKDLNVACMVLAHTTKGVENRDGGRPKLSDLRGSGDIAAEADFVAFMYRPYQHATKAQIEEGSIQRTDAELLYEKNRHGLEDAAKFTFEPSTMHVE